MHIYIYIQITHYNICHPIYEVRHGGLRLHVPAPEGLRLGLLHLVGDVYAAHVGPSAPKTARLPCFFNAFHRFPSMFIDLDGSSIPVRGSELRDAELAALLRAHLRRRAAVDDPSDPRGAREVHAHGGHGEEEEYLPRDDARRCSRASEG